MKCEERILTQLPLVGLAGESVESPDLPPSKQPHAPTVRWADDPKEWQRQYSRQHYFLNRERKAALGKIYQRKNRNKISDQARFNQRVRYAAKRELLLKKMREYRRRKPWIFKAALKRYYSKHREALREWNRLYHIRNRAHRNANGKRWKEANWQHVLAKRRERFRTNIQYAIGSRLRNSLLKAVVRFKTQKVAPTFALLGCSIAEFLKHLESKFLPGMTWENRGKWELDHVRPVASFDLTDPEQQRACFHYTNIQPLWEEDNLRKRAQWVPTS